MKSESKVQANGIRDWLVDERSLDGNVYALQM